MTCLVCGAKSTGVHYGVTSCESCKGFFRRSFTKRRTYQCKAARDKRGQCQIQFPEKNCPACRYQKCQHVGMSKEGIQLGRRPGKTKNAVSPPLSTNVSSLAESNPADTDTVSPDTTYTEMSRMSPDMYFTEFLTVAPDIAGNLDIITERTGLHKTSTYINDNVLAASFHEIDEMCVDAVDIATPPRLTCDDVETNMPEPNLPTIYSEHLSSDTVTVPLVENELLLTTQASSVQDVLREGTEEYIDPDAIIETITTANANINPQELMALKWNELEESHAKHREELEMEKELYGEVEPVSPDDYQAFYSCTGIDLDNYVGDFKDLLRGLSDFVNGMIRFAKHIPGFKHFSLKDQASLIRGTCHEYYFLSMYRTMNYRFNILTMNTGELLTKERLSRYVSYEYRESLWTFPGKMQRLGLTIDDNALLKAVCVTCADRISLEYPEQVERVHLRLVHCFRRILKRNHSDHNKLFGKVIDRLVDMRTMAVLENKEMMNLLLRWPSDLWDSYGLLHEMFRERTDL